MPIRPKWALAPSLSLLCLQWVAAIADTTGGADAPPAAVASAPEAPGTIDVSRSADAPQSAAEQDVIRQAFVAAMQRVRLNLPDTPDPPALVAYAIHDYLVAARYR